jgi:hypothetical protein
VDTCSLIHWEQRVPSGRRASIVSSTGSRWGSCEARRLDLRGHDWSRHRVILSTDIRRSTRMDGMRNTRMEDTHSIRRRGKPGRRRRQHWGPTSIHHRPIHDDPIHHDDHHDDHSRPGLRRDQLTPGQRRGLTWRPQQPSASSTLPSASECDACFLLQGPSGPSEGYVSTSRQILGLRNLMQSD